MVDIRSAPTDRPELELVFTGEEVNGIFLVLPQCPSFRRCESELGINDLTIQQEREWPWFSLEGVSDHEAMGTRGGE